MYILIQSIPISAAIPSSNGPASLKSNNQNIIASTANNNNNNNNNNNTPTPITGQLIYKGQGKIVSQRVIPPDTSDGTYKIEVSYSGGGSFNGLNVTEMWTFVNTYKPNGVIQGVGQGAISTRIIQRLLLQQVMEEDTSKKVGITLCFPQFQLYRSRLYWQISFFKNIYWSK